MYLKIDLRDLRYLINNWYPPLRYTDVRNDFQEIRDLQQNIKQYGRNIEHKHKNRFLNIIPCEYVAEPPLATDIPIDILNMSMDIPL